MVGVKESISWGTGYAKLMLGVTYGAFDDSLILDESAVAGTFGAVTEAAAELAASDCSGWTEEATLLILNVADLW